MKNVHVHWNFEVDKLYCVLSLNGMDWLEFRRKEIRLRVNKEIFWGFIASEMILVFQLFHFICSINTIKTSVQLDYYYLLIQYHFSSLPLLHCLWPKLRSLRWWWIEIIEAFILNIILDCRTHNKWRNFNQNKNLYN